jgi:hypothetical protein
VPEASTDFFVYFNEEVSGTEHVHLALYSGTFTAVPHLTGL